MTNELFVLLYWHTDCQKTPEKLRTVNENAEQKKLLNKRTYETLQYVFAETLFAMLQTGWPVPVAPQ